MQVNKTIKQIADELKIDKQKVYRFIKKHCINEAHQKDGIMYYDEAVQKLIISHFIQNTTSSEAHQSTSNDAVNDAVLKQFEAVIETLKIQLEAKDKQLEQMQKLLDQQQQLNLMDKQKVLQIEEKAHWWKRKKQ